MIDSSSLEWQPLASEAWIGAGAAVAVIAVVLGAVRARSLTGWLGGGVRLVAVAALVTLALGPRVPQASQPAAWSDTDVYLVLDATASMGAVDGDDEGQTRLEVAKRDAVAILDELAASGARASVIAFQREARVVVPVTTDANAAARGVASLQPEVVDGAVGSDVAVAAPLVAASIEAQQDLHPRRSSLVIYLGDGENTSGASGSFALVGASAQGSLVLGYGSGEGAEMLQLAGSDGAPAKFLRDPGTGEVAISARDSARLDLLAGNLAGPLVLRAEHELPALEAPSIRPAPATEDGLQGGTENLAWRIAIVLVAALLVDLALTLVAFARAGIPWRRQR